MLSSDQLHCLLEAVRDEVGSVCQACLPPRLVHPCLDQDSPPPLVHALHHVPPLDVRVLIVSDHVDVRDLLELLRIHLLQHLLGVLERVQGRLATLHEMEFVFVGRSDY